MTFLIMNVNEIGKNIERVVCVPLIRVKATLEGEVTYLRGETIIRPCKMKLMIQRRNYVMRNGSDPFLVLTALLMMKTTLATDEGQELRRTNLSLAMKSLTTGENIIVHPAKV